MTNDSQRAIIFDMDGTLIDSEPSHLKAYQIVLADFGLPWTEVDNREFLGRTDAVVCATVIDRYKLSVTVRELIERKEQLVKEQLRKEGKPRAGVMSVLRSAQVKQVRMAVASSASMATIDFVIDILAIRNFFHTIASGEEVAHSKPAPDVFLLASKRLNVKPSNCLVIEDTVNGIKAAKSAGMQCIAIPCDTTKHEDHWQADRRLESLEEFDLNRWLTTGVL